MSVRRQEITIPYHGKIETLMYGGLSYSIGEISSQIQRIGTDLQPMNTRIDRVECYNDNGKKVGYVFLQDVKLSIQTIEL
jgi:hypothetical protein